MIGLGRLFHPSVVMDAQGRHRLGEHQIAANLRPTGGVDGVAPINPPIGLGSDLPVFARVSLGLLGFSADLRQDRRA